MMRWIAILVLGIANILPVYAQKPTITYFDAEPTTLTSDQTGCTFNVLATPLNSRQKLATFVDKNGNVRFSLITGGNIYLFTNLSTGRSHRMNLSGPGILSFEPGDTFHVIARGSNVLFFPPGSAPGFPRFALTHGRLDITTASDFTVLSLITSTGNVQDVCTLLS
jgi:hypothetical protein